MIPRRVLAVAALIAASGCTSPRASLQPDAGLADAAREGGRDAGDGGAQGLLERAPHLVIEGVTTDGHVIYVSETAVKAAPLAGGAPVTLATIDDGGGGGGVRDLLSHDDLYRSTGVDAASGVGALAVWSRSFTTPHPLSLASVAGRAAASVDSQTLVFSSHASPNGAAGDVMGATLGALAAPVTLASNVDLRGRAACPAQLSVTGSGASAVAVVVSCHPTTDAGPIDAPPTAVAYPAGAWTPQPLASDVLVASVDSVGTAAALALGGGALVVAPLSGAPLVPLEPPATLGPIPYVYLNRASTLVAYATAAGALRASPTTAALPRTLVDAGVYGIAAIAPDDRSALVYKFTIGSAVGLVGDLSLASLTTPGPPTTLSVPTVVGVLGDPFTADSAYVAFTVGVSIDLANNYVGRLMALSASGQSVVELAAASVSSASGSPTDLALGGSRLSFVDAFDPTAWLAGTVTLSVVDLVSPAAIVVARGVDPFYAASSDGRTLVYTVNLGGPDDGLYAVPVPLP